MKIYKCAFVPYLGPERNPLIPILNLTRLKIGIVPLIRGIFLSKMDTSNSDKTCKIDA